MLLRPDKEILTLECLSFLSGKLLTFYIDRKHKYTYILKTGAVKASEHLFKNA